MKFDFFGMIKFELDWRAIAAVSFSIALSAILTK